MPRTKWLLSLAALALMPRLALAAEPIGAAVVVVNQVTAALEGDLRTLADGNNVHQNELIEVAADASSELQLNDNTKMALGPGARLLLDKFVYDGEKTKGNIAVNLVKGAFRFITGVATKPSYVVRVPQASITVRGTIFDVFVQDNGVSWLLLHEGAVRVCNDRGTCRDLEEPGKLIRITDNGSVDPPGRWNKIKKESDDLDEVFPFIDNKPDLSPPVLTREAILIDIDKPKVKDDPPPRRKADKPKRAKKKYTKSRKAKKQRSRKRRAERRRRRQRANDKAAMEALGIAAGIAAGIAIGKSRGGKRHHNRRHRRPRY